MNIFDLHGKVVKALFLTSKIKFVTVEVMDGEGFGFASGQFANIEVAPNFYRSYSICSSVSNPKRLEFVVDITPGGKGSIFFQNLKEGDSIHVKAPFGRLVLPQNMDTDLYFVGTGTGVAPVRSIVMDLMERGLLERTKVTLLWGLRYKEDIYFEDEFKEISQKHPNFKLCVTLSRPENWEGECGHVSEHLKTMDFDKNNTTFLLCGNSEMVDEVTKLLLEGGVDQAKIISEKFF